ncbi:metallophosphoesterase family protein [Pedobacter miscanthi]|uniref:metallophosphoesterase family protein n=1 Tax=Pedobacter miscanthi TaxID=2259170 RepID=UPI003977428A
MWPNEVIGEIRRRGIATIAGNHDLKVLNLNTTPESLSEQGKKYAYHIIDEGGRDYLKTLPAHIKLEFQLGNSKLNVVLAHGSTRKVDEYILVDTDEQYVIEMMDEAGADILFVGHSHKPYHRIINNGGLQKHVINTGSVGKPKDGDPRGCYVILTLEENSSVKESVSIKVEFRRISYDVEKAATAIENSLLPSEFADMLRDAF